MTEQIEEAPRLQPDESFKEYITRVHHWLDEQTTKNREQFKLKYQIDGGKLFVDRLRAGSLVDALEEAYTYVDNMENAKSSISITVEVLPEDKKIKGKRGKSQARIDADNREEEILSLFDANIKSFCDNNNGAGIYGFIATELDLQSTQVRAVLAKNERNHVDSK